MELPKYIKDEIWEYCRVNDIPNIDDFILKLVKQGFTVEKYGATPTRGEKVLEKIVDRMVEVPVEKIVERVVEVPIAMVDTELSELTKKQHDEIEKLNAEILSSFNLTEQLKKELETCKKERKTDIYGER